MAPAKQRRPKREKIAVTTPSRPELPTLQRPWLLALVLIAAVVAFSGAWDAPFQLDDIPSIPRNPTVQQLSAAALSPPGGGLAVSGRPVVNVSIAANRAIDNAFGIDESSASSPHATAGYHVANILLHLLCGLLLFGIVRRTLLFGRWLETWRRDADGIALAVAALWLLHPIQTEAVDYVVQRTELLVSLFYAGTVYASIRAWDAATQRRRLGWYAVAVASCLLGMGSKEVMVSAPLIVLLYDRAFRADSWKSLVARPARRTWFYVALFATLLWLAVLVSSGARDTTVGFGGALSVPRYFYTQAWAISRYLRLLFWPAGLIYDYGSAPIDGLIGVPGLLLLGALGIATLVAWTRDRWRWFGFAGAWFFLLLGPSSSVVPIRTEIAAERRIYLASAAIIVMVVVGIVALMRRVSRADETRATQWRNAGRAALVIVSAIFAVLTFERSSLYRNPEALWRDVIAKRPSNPRAYDNLAAVVLQKDSTRRPEAEQLFRQAIAVDSTYVSAWTNLSDVQMAEGRTADAHAVLEHVLRIAPQYIDANARMGGVLIKEGDLAHGIPMLERVVASAPTDELYVLLGTAYMTVGRSEDAANALRRAVALNPARTDVAAYVGALLAQNGHPDQAIPYLENAARAPDAQAMVYALLSLSYAQLNQPSQVQAAASFAVQRAGKDERVYLTLGQALLLVNRVPDAVRVFGEGVRLAPSDPEAITRLGIAKAAGGDMAGAQRLFRQALSLTPDYGPAVQALAHLNSR